MANKKSKPQPKKKPWPTKKAMEQVYSQGLWGTTTADFYSGSGSHHPDVVNPYLEALTSFLTSFETPLKVCDLGCGDFNVGKQLVKHTTSYIAVDIVQELIDYNSKNFEAANLEFRCLDIAKDDLPSGDCALLRQVLQHLSNAEIALILNKLQAYNYVIITEHLPKGDFIPNKDIISGQGTRLKKQSGVKVLEPPFNFEIKEEKELVSVDPNDGKGVIVTTGYELF